MRAASFFCIGGSFLFLSLLNLSWVHDADALLRKLPSSTEEIRLSFTQTVKRSAPSVVTVYAKRIVQTRTPLWRNPFFDDFFGGGAQNFGIPRERIERALGSGVILGKDGIIVTNYHVVRDSEELTVALDDRREFEAKMILLDRASDLAVLKIDVKGEALPILPFGDSDNLETGDIVLAIGNPFGLGQTVTNGIISAPARARPGISDIGYFLQTDAAINVGNSGGALVSLDGKLAGINTAIYTKGAGSVGIGFAIPANLVRRVVEAAQTGKPLTRLWIGAEFQSVSPQIASALNLASPSGVLIKSLYEGGPADKSGLQRGDIIRQFGAHKVSDLSALRYRIETSREDNLVQVAYLRNGEERLSSLRVGAPPEIPPRDETKLLGSHLLEGAVVANLSPALAGEINLSFNRKGIVVLSVQRGSRARRFIKPKDIILEAEGKKIPNVAALAKLLEAAQKPRRFVLEREGRRISIAIR